ncbi:hypothetical protein B0H10DRAFT_1953951 [Mycena sp. CBHHK59/15]|nr:hypothetical protein B0H10DRAFT_1953951 [Mycena sp. CBHHK59/15]
MLNTPNREDILHGVAELDDDQSRGMDAKRRGDWEVALFGTPTPAQCTLLVQDMAAEGWGSGGKVGGRRDRPGASNTWARAERFDRNKLTYAISIYPIIFMFLGGWGGWESGTLMAGRLIPKRRSIFDGSGDGDIVASAGGRQREKGARGAAHMRTRRQSGFISLYLATHGGGRRDNGREGGRAGRPAHTATHALLKLVYCEVLQGLLLVALQDLAAS